MNSLRNTGERLYEQIKKLIKKGLDEKAIKEITGRSLKVVNCIMTYIQQQNLKNNGYQMALF